jgi:transcription initiation factor TFIIB
VARALEGKRRSRDAELDGEARTERKAESNEKEIEPGESTARDERERERCPECGGNVRRALERAELVCSECGLVLEEEGIDHGPEWRAFDQGEREARSRVGAPVTRTLHDKGLSTTIGWRDEDANGRTLAPEKRARIERLRRWQGRIRTSGTGERTLRATLSEIDRMASALGVPGSVREVAGALQRRASEADLMRGRSVEGIASAVLYTACRLEGIPRSLDEIAGVSRVERTEIGRAYRYLVRELELRMEPTDPGAYVGRYCSDLDCSEEVRAKAIELLDAAAAEGLLSGRSPTGSAAAAVYAAGLLCEEKRSQSAVAEVAEITEVTIRNRYREHLQAAGVFEGM